MFLSSLVLHLGPGQPSVLFDNGMPSRDRGSRLVLRRVSILRRTLVACCVGGVIRSSVVVLQPVTKIPAFLAIVHGRFEERSVQFVHSFFIGLID